LQLDYCPEGEILAGYVMTNFVGRIGFRHFSGNKIMILFNDCTKAAEQLWNNRPKKTKKVSVGPRVSQRVIEHRKTIHENPARRRQNSHCPPKCMTTDWNASNLSKNFQSPLPQTISAIVNKIQLCPTSSYLTSLPQTPDH